MRDDYTHIVFVLDRSGSMGSVWGDVVGGLKEFIKTHQAASGEATFTLVAFDDSYEVIHNFTNIEDINPDSVLSEIRPRSTTALFDAVGKTINGEGEKLSRLAESERPSKVLFTIQTDGLENASKEYSAQDVKKLISHQRDKYNWVFSFVGAGEDAALQGQNMGIKKDFVVSYTANNTGKLFSDYANKTTLARYATSLAETQSAMSYTVSDRDTLTKEK